MKKRGKAKSAKTKKPSPKPSSKKPKKSVKMSTKKSRGAKPSKKKSRSTRTRVVKSTGSLYVEPMEQVTVACSNCGRTFNIVKLPGLTTEGLICQRCEVGEIQFPE